jgi:hypothetical protein
MFFSIAYLLIRINVEVSKKSLVSNSRIVLMYFMVRSCRCLETGGLDRVMSEFVYARLGLDGVQSGHMGVYWFR